jgi:hypothetical protein
MIQRYVDDLTDEQLAGLRAVVDFDLIPKA